jgi:hypothetical protein
MRRQHAPPLSTAQWGFCYCVRHTTVWDQGPARELKAERQCCQGVRDHANDFPGRPRGLQPVQRGGALTVYFKVRCVLRALQLTITQQQLERLSRSVLARPPPIVPEQARSREVVYPACAMSSKMALASKEIDFERLVETITEGGWVV